MNEAGIGILQVGSLGYQGITINTGNIDGVGTPPGTIDTPIAQNATVREALSMSVDREALVSSVFNDWYDPACSPISPASPFTSALSENCPAYDPEGAQVLLEEAGVELPYPINMLVSNNPDTLRFAQALQASVADGGFELTISPVEYSTLLDLQTSGDFDTIQLGWSGRVDPHGNMYNFLGTGQGHNYTGYSNADVDTLLTDAAATTDIADRADLYGQAIAQVQKDNPIVYLYRQRTLTAYSTGIAGIETFADGVVHLSDVAFVESE
jgi:peptide/nickel transport system substrate-binding protein